MNVSDAGAVATHGIGAHAPPRARSFAMDPADFGARFTIGVLFLLFCVRLGQNFLQTGRITGLLLLASEFLVVVLTVFRRPAVTVDRRWHSRVIVAASLTGPLLVRPTVDGAVLPDAVTALVSGAGLLAAIAGKVALGRSFGLLPANRGIVCAGPYRLIRHPIYLGYLMNDAGFLLAHLTLWNLVVLLIGIAAQMVRILYEETMLAHDASYAAYRQRVRWRVLPHVF